MQSQQTSILYVEDDLDTRDLVTLLLASQSCKVTATENHNRALHLAQTENFDLYLLDNWMPGTSGVRLCEQLREFDQQTPILFYSGAAYKEDQERALSLGAQGYIVKPADADELVAQIFRLISDSKSGRATKARTA